ncbi:hypothetical protein LZ31DRAFT_387580 [Colletotrichum somersetense]|nr:hypothetical protein LZ31DRAFT_387580 [Colletotrichum somersetense]
MTVQLNDLMLKDAGCHYRGVRASGWQGGMMVQRRRRRRRRRRRTDIAPRGGRGRRRPGGERRERRRGRTETKEEPGGENGRPDARAREKREREKERGITSLGWWENVSRECTGHPSILQMRENGLLCDEAFVPLWWPAALRFLPLSPLSVRMGVGERKSQDEVKAFLPRRGPVGQSQ